MYCRDIEPVLGAMADFERLAAAVRARWMSVLTDANQVNYIRGQDDIGWAVSDKEAAPIRLSGPAHRAFMSDSSAFALLVGLSRALDDDDEEAARLAVERVLLGHAFIASCGGIPLIYKGDEVAAPNDWSSTTDPEIAHDSRWISRPVMERARVAHARSDSGPEAVVLEVARHNPARRAATPEPPAACSVDVLDPPRQRLFRLPPSCTHWGAGLPIEFHRRLDGESGGLGHWAGCPRSP